MFKSFFQFSSSTEQKIKNFIDDTKGTKKSNTLMQEIAVLTFSPKTLKEIVAVFRKRLQLIANIMLQYQELIGKLEKNKRSGNRGDFNGNKSGRGGSVCGVNTQLTHQSLQVLNALTLMEYLLTNGSDDFVSWTKRNLVYYIAPLMKINFPGASTTGANLDNNPSLSLLLLLQKHSHKLQKMISDTQSISKQREEIVTFRNSISFAGRTSTDNSPLKKKFQYDGTTRSASLDFSSRYSASPTVGKKGELGKLPKRSQTLYTNYKQRGRNNGDDCQNNNPFLQRNDYNTGTNNKSITATVNTFNDINDSSNNNNTTNDYNNNSRNYARRSLDLHSHGKTLGPIKTHGLQSLNTQGNNSLQFQPYHINNSPTTSYRSYTSSPLSAGTGHLDPVVEE
ncbi:hypothetical protein ACO0RG_003676 [Hanseniaspora osmophila]|uniref:Epsin-4 n=1 Tax=Hanseniaspora osmophila TaxID=56408 RepID=A0A1E5RGC1_9ASCO|nr:Epsin-4 [Hanseniaspora osmophila]